MLPSIVDAVGDKLDIFFDSGIRAGADIAKAMALGAKLCLVGRPYGKLYAWIVEYRPKLALTVDSIRSGAWWSGRR